MDAYLAALKEWNKRFSERTKLQHAHILTAVLSVVVCGIISLFDPNLGRELLIIPVALGLVFLINWMIWSLLKTTVIDKLGKK